MANYTIIFALLVMTGCPLIAEIGDREIKGLYTIFAKNHSLSPLHGFVWWKRMIEPLYRFGNETHATVQLLRELFYLNECDHVTFGCTILPSKPATYFTPTTIGELVSTLYHHTNPYDNGIIIEKIIATIERTINFTAIHNAGLQRYEDESRRQAGQLDELKEALGHAEKNKKKYKEAEEKICTVLQDMAQRKHNLRVEQKKQGLESIIESKMAQIEADYQKAKAEHIISKNNSLAATSLYKKLKHDIRQCENQLRHVVLQHGTIVSLATLITNAHAESISGNRQRYPTNTVINILLAFLWKQAKQKSDFITYMQAAINPNDLHNPAVLNPLENAHQSWLKEIYPTQPYKVIRLQLTEITAAFEKNPDITLAKHYEELIMLLYSYHTSTGILPPLVPAGWTTFKDYRFPDCACTALRNMFNHLLYDSATGQFNPDALENQTSALAQFYQTYSSVESIHDDQVRQAWAAVLSNLNEHESSDELIDYKTPEHQGICEIASRSGFSNIIRVIKKLTGIGSLKELCVHIGCHRKLSLDVNDKPLFTDNWGTIDFYVNNHPLTFHAQQNHYFCTHQQHYCDTDEHINNLMHNIRTHIIAMPHEKTAQLAWHLCALYRDTMHHVPSYATMIQELALHNEHVSLSLLISLLQSHQPDQTLESLEFILKQQWLRDTPFTYPLVERLQKKVPRQGLYLRKMLNIILDSKTYLDTRTDAKQLIELLHQQYGIIKQQFPEILNGELERNIKNLTLQ